MTIAIHISARDNKPHQSFNFIIFSKIAADHPSDHFIFIFDTTPDPEIYLEPNCTPVIAGPAIKNLLLLHYWYNFKLPGVIAKYNASVFVSSGVCCSSKTDARQIAIANALTFKNKRKHVKRLISGWLKRASAVIATNELMHQELTNDYAVSDEKIRIIHPGLPDRNTFAGVEEHPDDIDAFFFADIGSGGINQVFSVLKAFSLFKKWQRSTFGLKLYTTNCDEGEVKKLLSNYKYRSSVEHVTEHNVIKLPFIEQAFALIFIGQDLPVKALAAMKKGVPVITVEDIIPVALFGDAVLYAKNTIDDMASKMMQVYKDEQLFKSLSLKGQARAQKYSWDVAASALWDVIADTKISS
jgi:glycosyltransferase involved in cell wall biosynthesis